MSRIIDAPGPPPPPSPRALDACDRFPARRAFAALERGDPAPSPEGAPRRIWEIDPSTLALVTGVLLRREDVEALLDGIGHRDHAGLREDALRVRLLLGCTNPCALAEAVEHDLAQRTDDFRAAVERCPMIQLAEWWSRERDRASGEALAALLWRLACDPRPHLEPLASKIGGHLCVRAMQLLRDGA
ncbi:hypothetical protein [Anaeromyxobacter dehalogenans]|uniref:hypothetical protein n=1 Tax=Anaeromyxobacter dehalogenans TaxID=161493 RepID=UPI00059C266B|nr:hypothetical protein [Anaeromyxobacter dehalogenans]